MNTDSIEAVRVVRRTFAEILLALAVVVLPVSARAQDMAEAAAHALDTEGTALLNQRQLAVACPKLEQSYQLKPGIGVLLRLALCQELSGKRATAQASYRDAAERASVAGNPQIAQLAHKRAAALESTLSHLTIELEPEIRTVPGLRVSRDGTALDVTKLDVSTAVDPGSHVIEATAPGRSRFEQAIVVGDQPRAYSVSVMLPVLPAAVHAAPELRAQPKIVGPKRSSWPAQRTFALAAGGVGVASLTAGTVLGFTVGARMRRARAQCTDGSSGCSEHALELQDQARGYAFASSIAFGVGVAGVLGGIALWLTAPHRTEQPAGAEMRLAPMVGLETGGIQAEGTW